MYVGTEYDAFREDLVAWEEAMVEDEKELGEAEEAAAVLVRERALADVQKSAYTLANVVRVATAQFKEVTSTDVLMHQYLAGPAADPAVAEAIRDLGAVVQKLREEIVALRQVVASLQSSAPPPATPRRGSRRRGLVEPSLGAGAAGGLDVPSTHSDDNMSDIAEP